MFAPVSNVSCDRPVCGYSGGCGAIPGRRGGAFRHQEQLVHRHVVAGGKVSTSSTAQLETRRSLISGHPQGSRRDRGRGGPEEAAGIEQAILSNVRTVLDWDNDSHQVNIRFEIESGVRARFAGPRSMATSSSTAPACARIPGSALDHSHLEADDADAAARALDSVRRSTPRIIAGSQGDAEDVKYDAATNRRRAGAGRRRGPRLRLPR